MALTVNIRNRSHSGNRRRRLVDVTWDSTYAAGGKVLSPSDLDLTSVDAVLHSHSTGLATARYDPVAGKLVLFTAGGPEASGDQSAVTSRLVVYGQ